MAEPKNLAFYEHAIDIPVFQRIFVSYPNCRCWAFLIHVLSKTDNTHLDFLRAFSIFVGTFKMFHFEKNLHCRCLTWTNDDSPEKKKEM